MHKARAFFFVCAGIFLLALAYHFGATTATAQAPGNPIVAAGSLNFVFTANGDCYYSSDPRYSPWSVVSNVFGSSPTPAQSISVGQLKAKYAK